MDLTIESYHAAQERLRNSGLGKVAETLIDQPTYGSPPFASTTMRIECSIEEASVLASAYVELSYEVDGHMSMLRQTDGTAWLQLHITGPTDAFRDFASPGVE